jgi:hypothetical protein
VPLRHNIPIRQQRVHAHTHQTAKYPSDSNIMYLQIREQNTHQTAKYPSDSTMPIKHQHTRQTTYPSDSSVPIRQQHIHQTSVCPSDSNIPISHMIALYHLHHPCEELFNKCTSTGVLLDPVSLPSEYTKLYEHVFSTIPSYLLHFQGS